MLYDMMSCCSRLGYCSLLDYIVSCVLNSKPENSKPSGAGVSGGLGPGLVRFKVRLSGVKYLDTVWALGLRSLGLKELGCAGRGFAIWSLGFK